MSQRDDSLFHTLLDVMAKESAKRLAAPEKQGAMYLTLMSIFYGSAARVSGGEWVYVPVNNRMEMEQRRASIALAIQKGESSAEIAKREGVDPSLVRRIRRRGTIRP